MMDVHSIAKEFARYTERSLRCPRGQEETMIVVDYAHQISTCYYLC